MIITITGRAGSGKDTVMNMLHLPPDYNVIDADQLGHQCLKDPLVIKNLDVTFPGCIHLGEVNRKALAKQAFPYKTHVLNTIVHPCLRQKIKAGLTKNTIIHAALLQELGLIPMSDVIVLVESTHDNTLLRAQDRFRKKDLLNRLKAQKSLPWYRQHADYRITNNGSLDELKQSVESLCQILF